jgi:hypothetical protein
VRDPTRVQERRRSRDLPEERPHVVARERPARNHVLLEGAARAVFHDNENVRVRVGNPGDLEDVRMPQCSMDEILDRARVLQVPPRDDFRREKRFRDRMLRKNDDGRAAPPKRFHVRVRPERGRKLNTLACFEGLSDHREEREYDGWG